MSSRDYRSTSVWGGEQVLQPAVQYPTWWSSASTVYVRGVTDFAGPTDYSFARNKVFLYPYGVEVPANSVAQSGPQIIPWSQIEYIELAT